MNTIPTTRFAALLRRVEHFGLKLDHGHLKKRFRGKGDGWWLANAEGEMTGPFLFEEILERLLDGEAAAAPAYIVHESVANSEPTPWRAVQHHPLWTQPKAVNWFRRGVIAFSILVAWMILRDLEPLRGEIAGTCLNLLFLVGILWLLWREYRERLQRIFPFLRSTKNEQQVKEARDDLKNPGMGMSAEKTSEQKADGKIDALASPLANAAEPKSASGFGFRKPTPGSLSESEPSKNPKSPANEWKKPDLSSGTAGKSAPPLPAFQQVPQKIIPLHEAKPRRIFAKALIAIVLLLVAGGFAANHYHLLPPAVTAHGQSAWNTLYAKGTAYWENFASKKKSDAAAVSLSAKKERLTALINNPSLWPKTVHLTKTETFPALINGKVAGSVQARSGTSVRVMAVSETTVTVGYLGAQKKIPEQQTDLLNEGSK